MDFSLCSPSVLFKFIDFRQEECKLGHGGRLGYVDAISELIDSVRKAVAKIMRLQWTQDLDIETLESKDHWATMEELLEVVTLHLPCYEQSV